MVEMAKFYEDNEDFKAYVDKYARDHRMLPEIALKSMVIKEAYKYYLNESKRAKNIKKHI